MVLADKNSEDIRNGRRSRGPSPNGHLSDEGSATEDSDHEDNGMRIGEEYQAQVPEMLSASAKEQYVDFAPDKALLVWSPSPDIPESKLDEFIVVSKEKYGYNAEQALGMLFWHKHDLEKALTDLTNFTPFPEEWSVEDKVLFEQAYQFHGKSFHRIRQMLPDKSMASLVRYYYSWKKTRCRTSLMDRQARKLATQREGEGSEVGSEAGSNSESELEGIDKDVKVEGGIKKTTCSNCSASCHQGLATTKGNLCTQCHQYWRKTGMMRPSSGPMKQRHETRDRHNPLKSRKKPPRGMYLSYDDLVAIVTGPPGQDDAILKGMDSEVISLKRQVQNNKQLISALKHKTCTGIDEFKPVESANRFNARWTNDELLLAVQGVRKYGKDFKAIAEVIGNKTEAHLRSFFINYRRRYNLDAVLKEYEAEYGPIKEEDKDEKEPDSSPPNASTTPPAATSPVVHQVTSSTPPTPLAPVSAPSVQSPVAAAQHVPAAVASGTPLMPQAASMHVTGAPPPLKPAGARPHLRPGVPINTAQRLPIPRLSGPPQNPPPLLRPNAVPIMATMKHGSPHATPQLMTRE